MKTTIPSFFFLFLQKNMLSTGDVQGFLRRLETLLRVIKYPGYVDYNGLSTGDASAFLPILSFTLISFSPPLAEQLTVTGLELTCKTDLRFTDTLYKVLRDVFNYKPILTKQQFLQRGFSQRKISVMCDVINLVLQKHNQLMKSPEVEERLSALEAQIKSHPGLHRLSILEKRIEELESQRNTDKEDLMDRVERITDMLRSTSCLLKNTESATTPCK
uniref:Centrosomal protein of 44 kDa n=1 Tax=Sparus aurata TaxID=8175 RepID=A0A671UWR2_SPAAU